MSDIALGHQVAASTSTDATTHTTASFAPTSTTVAGLVLIVNHHTATTATAMAAPTGACLTNLNKVASLAISSNRMMDIWLGTTTASSSAVVFHYNETATAAVWTIQEFLNVDLTRGLNNLIQGLVANLSQNSGIGTALDAGTTFKPVQHPSNAIVAIWGASAALNNTPESGWTEVDDSGIVGSGGAPDISQAIDWRIGTDTTPTSSYGSSVTWVGYAIELWGKDGNGLWSAIETFTKANSNGWGDDQNWSTLSHGGPSVLSNQAASNGANVYADNFLANDSSSGNHEARVQITQMPLSGTSVVGLRLRCHTATAEAFEFIRVGASSLGSFSVVLRFRDASGIYTTLAGPTVIASSGGQESLYFTAVGNTLTCYLNGTQVLAATSTLISSSRNRGGLVIRASTNQDTLADNFQFGDIGKTNSPKQFASTGATTASKAKASITKKWTNLAKSGTADQAFATLSSRIARLTARSGSATSARATSFATQVEGFSVTRRYLTKAGTASSAKGTITTGNKTFAGKIPSTTFSGGVFHPIFLDVKKGQQGARITASNSAKATLIKNVGQSTKVFQSDNATGYIQGLTTRFNVTVPTVSNVTVIIGGTTSFFVKVPQVQGLVVAEWIFPPGLGGVFVCPINDDELPTTTVQKQIGDRLMRHYRPRPVGRNVYIYSDGTVSENDPDGYSTLWRESARMGDTPLGIPTVVRVFFGGHDGEPVTQTEAQLLVAAGYTVRGYHP